jgi:hypothetical protein
MIDCIGWWEQRGLGRQSMSNLVLDFQGASITGQGRDVIAPFELSGKLRPDGSVEILKQYRYRHSVLYVGNYDGEGTLSGSWDIGGHQGAWSIRLLKSQVANDDNIQDIG